MKKILVAAVFAAVWAAPIRAEDTHESLRKELIKEISGLADVLATIKGKETLDSAKPKIKETSEKIAGLAKRFDKLGKPSSDLKAELDKKYEPKLLELTKKVQDEMNRIGKLEGGKDILLSVTEALDSIDKKKK